MDKGRFQVCPVHTVGTSVDDRRNAVYESIRRSNLYVEKKQLKLFFNIILVVDITKIVFKS